MSLERLLVVEGYMDAVRLHQSGIQYAVATLGTATTPEHLRRIFRLVREVVFAFDGDRAGRAAAWRALQHALPEARAGREIRFLFLPEGHDPDTLVGAEGREAFERRLDSTLPLSEYLVRELSEQTDLSHADGRARFAESARPLVTKVPEGVYRELLTGRVAQVVGLAAERLQEIWAGTAHADVRTGAGTSTSAAGASTATAEASAASAPSARTRARLSSGRGSLVRQAVTRLVRFPAIAGSVSAVERAGLEMCGEPGIELLRELLDELRVRPLSVPAQVLERWADRNGGEHLGRLLEREEVLGDAQAAALELKATLGKLAEQAADRRLEALEARIRASGLNGLSAEERKEFQLLIDKRGARKASP